jgi:hypothetical protein
MELPVRGQSVLDRSLATLDECLAGITVLLQEVV